MLASVTAIATRPLAQLFKALGDETRLRIVALLSHGELCVCHLQEALDLSQPTTSRHLGVLRAAQLVTDRRAGTWIYYSLSPQNGERQRQLAALVAAFSAQPQLKRDVARLTAAKGATSCK
jgi:ArsR family transcriptional regulator, arsenate/arsenite/antimonite-responsive transcriptional repressor